MRARNARLFGVAALIEGAPDPRSPIPDRRAIQRFGSGNAIKGAVITIMNRVLEHQDRSVIVFDLRQP